MHRRYLLRNAAVSLVGSHGLVTGEVVMGQAESHAAAGIGDGGEGFFSASGWRAGRMPGESADLPCVHDLNERLRIAV